MIKLENDLGEAPLLFAYITRDRAVIGTAMMLCAFIFYTIGGVPAAFLIVFAGVNDLIYAREHDDDEPQPNQTLLPPNGDSEADPWVPEDSCPAYRPSINTQLHAIDVETVDPEPKPADLVLPPTKPLAKRSVLRIDEDMAQTPESTIIVGISGSGKGILVSNVCRRLKAKYPQLYIMAIDPAHKTNENGYWTEGFDDVRRCRIDRLSKGVAADWLWEGIQHFQEIPTPKLLVLDEAVLATMALAGSPELFARFKQFLVSIITSGNGRREYLYLMTPIPHIQDLGISGGVRSTFNRTIALVSARNMSATNSFLNTRFVPVPNKDVLLDLMNQSPATRAYFDSKTNKWHAMPLLQNYSGFNRDLPISDAKKPTENYESKAQKLIANLRDRNDAEASILLGFIAYLQSKDGDTITYEMCRSSYWAKKYDVRNKQMVQQCIYIAKTHGMVKETSPNTYLVLDF
jgi:hypothetical protein